MVTRHDQRVIGRGHARKRLSSVTFDDLGLSARARKALGGQWGLGSPSNLANRSVEDIRKQYGDLAEEIIAAFAEFDQLYKVKSSNRLRPINMYKITVSYKSLPGWRRYRRDWTGSPI